MSNESPAVIIYDENGVPIAVADGAALPVGQSALLVAGKDGSGDAQHLLTDTDGSPIVVGAGVAGTPAGGVVSVQGVASGTPIPVTQTGSSPLPTGAATEATLALIKAKTDNLDVALSTRAVTGLTDAQLRASPVPVSAASLPLPTGAATAALQTQPGVDIGDVTVNNAAGAAAVNIQDGGNSITVDGTVAVSGSVAVTGPLTDTELRATPVPVSGTVTANAGTGTFAVSAAALPLPTGAATAALQTQPGVDIGDVTVNNAAGAAAVNIQDGGNSITVDGPLTDAQLRASAVPVSATSLPLPTGAATAANQTTLGSQTTKINDGTNTAAVKPASTAAVAADPALVVTLSPNTAPITAADASVSATGGAAPGFTQQNGGTDGTDLQPNHMFDLDTGVGEEYNLGVSLRKAAGGGSVELGTSADPLRTDPTGTTTQPISAASLPLPTGAATAALQTQPGVDIGDVTVNNAAGAAAVNIQDGGNSITVDGTVAVSGSVAVTGPLTDVQLRATPVPVSGTVTANAGTGTFAVTAASLPLPAGAATAALQTQPGVDIGDVTVNNAAGAAAVNIQDGGNSITVDGPLTDAELRASAVPVSAASLPLPTGAATEATLATRLADATFTGRINTLGQKAMAASTPVVLASDQSTIHVDGVGVAGTPAGGVHSIQGVVGGTPLPISGTITASDASVGLIGAAAPTSTQQNGGTDGTNLQANHMFDLDSGAGAEYNLGVSLRKAAGGGSVAFGTNTDPVRTDPTGTTTQPISAAALPLPTGAATAALQTQPGVDIGDVTVNNAAGAAAVNIQDGGNSITVDGTVAVSGSVAVTGPLTDAELRATPVPVSGTVTANAGTGTFAVSAASLPLPAGAATAALQTQPGVDIGDVTVNNAAGAAAVNIQDGGNSITVDGTVTANIGTTGGLALAATQTDGTQKAIVRGGAKGTTTAADVTSTAQSADRQGLDVQIRTSTGVAVDTFGGGTQFADGAARGTATGTLAMGDDGTNIQSLNCDTTGKLNLNNISGTVSLPTGAATSANQTTLGSQTTKINDGTNTATVKAASTAAVAADTALVVAISPNNPISVSAPTSATGTVTSVASSITNVTILASNASRKGARITNDGNKKLYLKCAATASTTSFTKLLLANEDWFVDAGYTGIIDGIWDVANGSARVTEYT